MRIHRIKGGEVLAAEAPLLESNAMQPLLRLDEAPSNVELRVMTVAEPPAGRDLSQRLEELGFLPGERLMVTARGQPGSDPLAVRVGHSTFALRRSEAAYVQVALSEAAE